MENGRESICPAVGIGIVIYFKVSFRCVFVTDKALPKAMVKPNILTHVIEGYVIQEAGEPFAVSCFFFFTNFIQNKMPCINVFKIFLIGK